MMTCEVGDHVEQRDNVGHRARTGVVIGILGDLLEIEWEDGHVTNFIPGPGALKVLTAPSRNHARSR